MFFSGKGLVRGSGVLESNEQECAVKQQMFKNSNEHYYLCDKTKVGRIGFIKLADIDSLAGIITDAEIDEEWTEELNEIGVQIIKC